MKIIEFQWKKLWSLKRNKLYLLFSIIMSILISIIFLLTTNLTEGKALREISSTGIIEINMLSIDVATIFLLIFVSLEMGREFHSKSIQTYVTVVPDRRKYFTSKLITYIGISIIIGITVGIISLVTGHLTLQVLNKQFPPIYETLRFFLGSILMPLTYVVFAATGTFFFRNTAGGILSSLLIMFLPIIVKVFPESIGDIFIRVIPASAIHSVSGIAKIGGSEDMGIVLALLVLIVWWIVGSLIAINSFRKKDI